MLMMIKFKMMKKIKYCLIIGICIFSSILYSQCEEGYTYFEEIPVSCTTIPPSNCFFENDIAILSNLISLNELSYESELEAGQQTWYENRLTVWVATYVPSGTNGLTEKINFLPDNIGQLDSLSTLYLEWHNLIQLPESFSNLTNLSNLAISNNYLQSLPDLIGNLTNLIFLDLGYNQLASIPESIGGLINLEYLFLFNNQLTSLPETICNLNLDWDGISPANYPYFASGGNYLCDCDLIPDCVESSANINISMEQNYYSFLLDAPQECSGLQNCCELNIHPQLSDSLGDLNADGGWNVLDIVTLANCILANNCAELENGCAGDLNGDGGYNVLDIVTLANCVLANNCGG